MNNGIAAAVGIATAIVGLATLAVLVSRNAQTGSVISAFGDAFGSAIREAVAPLTAGNSNGM
jgi:hypothetical protein